MNPCSPTKALHKIALGFTGNVSTLSSTSLSHLTQPKRSSKHPQCSSFGSSTYSSIDSKYWQPSSTNPTCEQADITTTIVP
ncbi:hypothetical protein LguiA_030721 [Lonicera macranthoides]